MSHAAITLAAAMLLVNVVYTARALLQLRRERRDAPAVVVGRRRVIRRPAVTFRVCGGNPRGNQDTPQHETPTIPSVSQPSPVVS